MLHIVLVFVPLRLWYPDEDWSIATGAMAAGIYAAIMVPCTVLWFGRWRRGPLEGLLAWAGRGLRGPTRPLGLGER